MSSDGDRKSEGVNRGPRDDLSSNNSARESTIAARAGEIQSVRGGLALRPFLLNESVREPVESNCDYWRTGRGEAG